MSVRQIRYMFSNHVYNVEIWWGNGGTRAWGEHDVTHACNLYNILRLLLSLYFLMQCSSKENEESFLGGMVKNHFLKRYQQFFHVAAGEPNVRDVVAVFQATSCALLLWWDVTSARPEWNLCHYIRSRLPNISLALGNVLILLFGTFCFYFFLCL